MVYLRKEVQDEPCMVAPCWPMANVAIADGFPLSKFERKNMMDSATSTIFLPPSDTVFGIHPDVLEESHRTDCIVLRAKEFSTIYLVGGYIGKIEQPNDCLEIYYIVSSWIRAHLFCVRMIWNPACSVSIVAMDMLPPGLVPLEALDLSARYGRAFRPHRFQPRLLPVSV